MKLINPQNNKSLLLFRSINSKSVTNTRRNTANLAKNIVIERKNSPIIVLDNNPQECTEYNREIYLYTRSIEGKYKICPDYMKSQKEINARMRAILVDWLADVSIRFKLLPETLFLTINIIDRYLQKKQVSKTLLQLVGISANLIACKYEEIYPPEIRDYIRITDFTFCKDEILDMEQKILTEIDFNLNIPSSNRFLQYFGNLIPTGKKILYLAQYLTELSLMKYDMLKYPPSMIAASSLYLSKKLTKDIEGLNEMTIKIMKYTKENLARCVKDIVEMLKDASISTLQSIRWKFSSEKYMEVGKMRIRRKDSGNA